MPIIFKLGVAIMTVATGMLALYAPKSLTGFTGLSPIGGRGVTEIRAIFGGLFIALGLYPILLGGPTAYDMLGWVYLSIAAVRLGSIFLDKSSSRSNWISLAAEVVFGVVLIL
jgi:hypothetical protein